MTAWSVLVPVPKVKKVSMVLPNLRSLMKKSDDEDTFFEVIMPSPVIPAR